MIFKSAYKKIKILKDAFRAQGYFESTPDKNGEFFLLKKISKHYQIFFDLGFYKGKISFLLRKINKNILIFAVDLVDYDFKNLKKKNIFFYKTGIYKKNGTKDFFFYRKRNELTSLTKRRDYNPQITKNYEIFKTKVEKFDFFCEKRKISKNKKLFVKIDTDGCEADILLGAKNILKNFNISGYFEYSSGWINYNKKLKDVFYYLKEIDFNIYRMTENGLILMRYFSVLDENYFQSHYFFTKENMSKLGFKKKKIISLTSNKKELFYF